MTKIPDATLLLASEVARELSENGLEPVLIGALALAAHGYTRTTADVDLAVAMHPDELPKLAAKLKRPDRTVETSLPDAGDPLGGVITIRRDGALPVQIVNFDNPPAGGFPALVRAAQREPAILLETTSLHVVSAKMLVFFKLYAGGPKSELDIMELLIRCPIELDQLKALAEQFRMQAELDSVLAKVGL